MRPVRRASTGRFPTSASRFEMPPTNRVAVPRTARVRREGGPRSSRAAHPARFVFDGVDWSDYSRLLRVFERQRLRTTYDDGVFEIMSPSSEHEFFKGILCRMVEVCAEETKSRLIHAGSMTLRLPRKRRGLEPDECFWIAQAAAVSGRLHIDPATDPPPDLAVEVDITSHVLDRLSVYASLGVRELWRRTRNDFAFLVLDASGEYRAAETSPSFAWLKSEFVKQHLAQYTGQDKLEFIAAWRDAVRQLLSPKHPRKPPSR